MKEGTYDRLIFFSIAKNNGGYWDNFERILREDFERDRPVHRVCIRSRESGVGMEVVGLIWLNTIAAKVRRAECLPGTQWLHAAAPRSRAPPASSSPFSPPPPAGGERFVRFLLMFVMVPLILTGALLA
ncbi:hypothetical protein EVAR_66450_1 [Eumeta japonica]|uniref:Uncharacterized protein n=1 Tax=Eumeta variegata TaxID=151549 RepID=A0A4C2A4E2_EUMVA|nr:hypothetical protein EVAR_66450_1 [Eumeta japonica]